MGGGAEAFQPGDLVFELLDPEVFSLAGFDEVLAGSDVGEGGVESFVADLGLEVLVQLEELVLFAEVLQLPLLDHLLEV